MKFYASIAGGGVCTISLGMSRIRIRVWILEPDLHRIFQFHRDIGKSYGLQILMKFNGSIAAGPGRNDYVFELDPDHSPDPGTGFSPDF